MSTGESFASRGGVELIVPGAENRLAARAIDEQQLCCCLPNEGLVDLQPDVEIPVFGQLVECLPVLH